MKLRLLLFSLLGSALLNLLSAEPSSYITTPHGRTVFTHPLVTGIPNAINPEVVAGRIARVIAAPGKETVAVSLRHREGNIVPGIKQPAVQNFQPAIFGGKRHFNLTQTFQTTSGDAGYCPAQPQDCTMNYRRRQVIFFQNNTEATIPLLISKNKLWHSLIDSLFKL